VEIPVYPLNFLESIDFASKRGAKHLPLRDAFFRFLYLGGFPIVHGYDYPKEAAWKLIADIYASALLRDTVQRHKIRDVELLERVVKFVFDNVGSLFSAKRVADFFKSQQRRIDLNTVYTYLNALESAFLIYRVPRFDVKGRELLKTNEKYFIGDHAMSYALFGQRDRLISGLLENIVFLDLKSKGFKVYTGKVGDKEVDFVAERGTDRIYIQVAYKVNEPSTLEREYASLLEIKDNYPKFLLTLDGDFRDNFQGIEALPVYEFLSRP
jgi:predicted AAA+ superfamily ATPase